MSDEGPYAGWSIPAIIHNYVVIRGDLSEQYARDQLADLIAERIAQARREAWDEGARAAQEWETRDLDRPSGDPPRNPYRAALRGDA